MVYGVNRVPHITEWKPSPERPEGAAEFLKPQGTNFQLCGQLLVLGDSEKLGWPRPRPYGYRGVGAHCEMAKLLSLAKHHSGMMPRANSGPAFT
jgi:hypothetical protein